MQTNLTDTEGRGFDGRESLNTGGKSRGGNSERGELHLGWVKRKG
jgi:hypothetical protein